MGHFLKQRKQIVDFRGEILLVRLFLLILGGIIGCEVKYLVFPTKHFGPRDHMWRFAQALTAVMPLQVFPAPLVNISNYRHLSRELRLKERHVDLACFRRPPTQDPREILIIDDVVTTGATLQATLAALGCKYPPAILCFAYKKFIPHES